MWSHILCLKRARVVSTARWWSSMPEVASSIGDKILTLMVRGALSTVAVVVTVEAGEGATALSLSPGLLSMLLKSRQASEE